MLDIPQFHSQSKEDIHLIKNFFGRKKDGFFIELGALDGVLYSNTKFFEDSMNWTGILIEPVPSRFEELKKNRPKCELHRLAICDKEGEVEFIGHNAYGGTVHGYGPELKEARINENKLPNETYKVPAKRFDQVVTADRVPHVDLFSIDVEGGEYEVLSTFDWNIDVSVVMYESSLKWKEEDLKKCEDLMKKNGFEFYQRYHGSEIWYRPDLITPLE
jgi:FkbM family methyltransferase